jgi:transposase-like protein
LFALLGVGRDGQVTNRPVYVVLGVSVAGERDIVGLWAGDGGEGAKRPECHLTRRQAGSTVKPSG